MYIEDVMDNITLLQQPRVFVMLMISQLNFIGMPQLYYHALPPILLNTGGHTLSSAEIDALRSLLSERVINDLSKGGLQINKAGINDITLEQVQYMLRMVGHLNVSSKLEEELQSSKNDKLWKVENVNTRDTLFAYKHHYQGCFLRILCYS